MNAELRSLILYCVLSDDRSTSPMLRSSEGANEKICGNLRGKAAAFISG
jgi:hypothetical protein